MQFTVHRKGYRHWEVRPVITLLVTAVVELEFWVHCTDTLPSWAVSSCQPRFMLPLSTDVLKYKLVKGCDLVVFIRGPNIAGSAYLSFSVSSLLCLAAGFSLFWGFLFRFLGVPGARLCTVTREQSDSSDVLSRSDSDRSRLCPTMTHHTHEPVWPWACIIRTQNPCGLGYSFRFLHTKPMQPGSFAFCTPRNPCS